MMNPTGADSGASTSNQGQSPMGASGGSGSEASVNQAPGRNDAGPSNVAPADSPWRNFPSVPPALTPLPSSSLPSLPSLPSLNPNEWEQSVEQPAPPQPRADDSMEPHNIPHGYWFTHRLILDYLKADMDTTFDRTPSYRKYQRVFELVVGPHYRRKARLVEVLADIANNPASNPTIEEARRIMNNLYQRQIKDRDLDNYNDDPLG